MEWIVIGIVITAIALFGNWIASGLDEANERTDDGTTETEN